MTKGPIIESHKAPKRLVALGSEASSQYRDLASVAYAIMRGDECVIATKKFGAEWNINFDLLPVVCK